MSSSLDSSDYSKTQLIYFKTSRIPIKITHNPLSPSQPAANHQSTLPDVSYQKIKANMEQSKIRKKKELLIDSLHQQLERHSIQHQQYVDSLKRKSDEQEKANNIVKEQYAHQIFLLKLEIERLTKLSKKLIDQSEAIKKEKNLLQEHYQHEMNTQCINIRYELEDQIKQWKKQTALQLTNLKNKHNQAILQTKGENIKEREELKRRCSALQKNLEVSTSSIMVAEHTASKILQVLGQEDLPSDLISKVNLMGDITLQLFRQVQHKATLLNQSNTIVHKLKRELELTTEEIEKIAQKMPIPSLTQSIVNPFNQQLQQKQSQLQIKHSLLDSRYKDMQNKYRELENRYRDLENRYSQVQQRNSSLQQKHTSLQQKHNQSTQQLLRYQQELSNLERINIQLKEEIQALRISNANSASTSDTLKTKDANHIQNIRNMFHYDDTLRGLKQTIQLQEQELVERNERIVLLEQKIDKMTSKLAGLNDQHEKKVRDILEAIGSSGASAKQVQSLTQAYEKQINIQKKEINRLQEDMRKIEKEVSEAKKQLGIKTSQLELLKTDLENACQANVEKSRKIEQLERELDDKKVAMDAMVNMFEEQMRHNKPS